MDAVQCTVVKNSANPRLGETGPPIHAPGAKKKYTLLVKGKVEADLPELLRIGLSGLVEL